MLHGYINALFGILFNAVTGFVGCLLLATGGLTCAIFSLRGDAKTTRLGARIFYASLAFMSAWTVYTIPHLPKSTDDPAMRTFKADAPGCVVKGPNGENLLLASGTGGVVALPRGSLMSGACFVSSH
ncbi:hypothetical protein [Burkholderia vietnamiensis]|uniref:hypothetical protein n=1 Tax=Burkholderia vietnamiensis TaxID=60552 RepID=UPI001593A3A3|nr:hypothetical protein [Burkholderia vietnamiensis]